MKIQNFTKHTSPWSPGRARNSIAAILLLGAAIASAEDVFVTAFKGPTASATDNSPCPPFCVVSPSTVSGSGASGPSSVSDPVPIIPASGRRMRMAISNPCTISVEPTDIVLTPASGSPNYTFTSLQHFGPYAIYITKGSTLASQSTNLTVKMTVEAGEGTLADANGVAAPGGVTNITAFNRNSPNNVWIKVGYITNTVANPTIIFTSDPGVTLSSTSGERWYMDAFWFQYVGDPCAGKVSAPGVDGPLVEGQNFVNVTKVMEGATNVSVYANSSGSQTLIGSTNSATGFAAGQLVVNTTSPLTKGTEITASQSKGGCSSTVGTSGPTVGGGPNASLKVLMSCYKDPALTGPIGANSVPLGSEVPYFLKATKVTFGTAPEGGEQILPDACWRTVVFQHGVDQGINMNSGGFITNNDAFCSLDGLLFTMDAADSGPYDIYVDAIMNGDTVLEDFESYPVGTTNLFAAPAAAAVPFPGATYLDTPNSSLISDNYAFDGTKSCRIQWQWGDAGSSRWARILANATTGKKYPQLDTKKPITVRYLVLPVGTTVAHKFNGTVGTITNVPVYLGSPSVTLGVPVTGVGSYTYQWTVTDAYLYNPTTSRTYTIGGGDYGRAVDVADQGTYTVTVSDGVCSQTRSVFITIQNPVPTITNQPAHVVVQQGSPFTLKVGADGHSDNGYPINYQWRTNGVEDPSQITDTYSVASASAANVGSYDVYVWNSYGYSTSVVATVDVVAPGVTAGTGTGLRASYRSTHYSTNAFSGAPTLVRVDPVVDFSWGTGTPDPLVSPDYFTARWSGQVQALGTDNYTISTVTDDGVRVWFNNQLVIDNWTLHGPTTNSATVALTGMNKYDLLMEYFENAVGATAKLYWQSAGGWVGWEPIPTSQLYPAAAPAVPVVTFGLSNGTNIVLNWGPGSYTVTSSTNIAGPWVDTILGATSPTTIPVGSEAAKFYRLKVQ